MVKKHIRYFHKNLSEAEFYLSRIFDSAAYPDLITSEVEANAKRLALQIKAGKELDQYIETNPLSAIDLIVNQAELMKKIESKTTALESDTLNLEEVAPVNSDVGTNE